MQSLSMKLDCPINCDALTLINFSEHFLQLIF